MPNLSRGQVGEHQVRLYAYLGDEASRAVVGDVAADGLKLSDWVIGIAQWGREVLAAMCCELARRSLAVAANHRSLEHADWRDSFDVESASRCLDFARQYIGAGDSQKTQLQHHVQLARQVLSSAELCVLEASGTDTSRRRALAAIESVAFTIAVLAWNEESCRANTLDGDDVELEAMLRAGPSVEAWYAVRAAKTALEWEDHKVREFIRGCLVPWSNGTHV